MFHIHIPCVGILIQPPRNESITPDTKNTVKVLVQSEA